MFYLCLNITFAQECKIFSAIKSFVENASIKNCTLVPNEDDDKFKVAIECKEGYEFSYKKNKETFIIPEDDVDDFKYRLKCYRECKIIFKH